MLPACSTRSICISSARIRHKIQLADIAGALLVWLCQRFVLRPLVRSGRPFCGSYGSRDTSSLRHVSSRRLAWNGERVLDSAGWQVHQVSKGDVVNAEKIAYKKRVWCAETLRCLLWDSHKRQLPVLIYVDAMDEVNNRIFVDCTGQPIL